MIGGLAGIGLLIGFLGLAWSGDFEDSLFEMGFIGTLIVIAFWCLIGIFLFPRTVGMAFTPAAFSTPIAFLIGLLRQGINHGLMMLLLGVAMFLAQYLIGRLRPEAGY